MSLNFTEMRDRDISIIVNAISDLEPTGLGDRFKEISHRLENGRVNEMVRHYVSGDETSLFSNLFDIPGVDYRYYHVRRNNS